MTGYKVFTHDFRSPIQGGKPVWDGTFPYTLPTVPLDTSRDECGSGWNFCINLANAFTIVGWWPTGRPSLGVVIEPAPDAIQRGTKWRTSAGTLVRAATEEEISAAIDETSVTAFGRHAAYMADEQRAWRTALSRPQRNAAAVECGLVEALAARGLQWSLTRIENARDAWDARGARDDWDDWGARDARDARDAWGARDACGARNAWGDWGVRGDRGPRDAWDAWGALTVAYASVNGWTGTSANKLTVGLRDAYANGLEIAMPVGMTTLGWTMVGQ